MSLPPCGVSKVTVLLMSPSSAPFSTTTPAVISENGHSFEVDPVNSRPSLRRYLNLNLSSASVGLRHGDHSRSVMFSLRTSRGWLVRQNRIYTQWHHVQQQTFTRNNQNIHYTDWHRVCIKIPTSWQQIWPHIFSTAKFNCTYFCLTTVDLVTSVSLKPLLKNSDWLNDWLTDRQHRDALF